MVSELLGIFGFNALIAFSGASALVATRWCSTAMTARFAGLAFATGFAYLGTAGSLFLIAGFSWTRREVLVVAALPAVVAVARSRTGREQPEASGGVDGLKAIGVGLAFLTVVRAFWQPLTGWDAWSFWTPKAESILHFHGLSASYFQSGVANADYPLLIPAMQSAAFRFIGTFDTTLVHVEFALLFVAFVAALTEVVGVGRARGAAIVAALVAVTPTLITQTLSAYADVPVAIFCSIGALLLWRAVTDKRPGATTLSVLLLTATASTKAEGFIFVAVVLVSIGIAARRSSLRAVAASAIAACAVTAVWHVWLREHHVVGDYHFSAVLLLRDPSRCWRALEAMATGVIDPRTWLLLPFLALAVLVTGWQSHEARRAVIFVGAAILGCFVALDVIYWGTSFPFQWHLDTSADRVITTPVFLAVVFAAYLVSDCRVDVSSRRRVALPSPIGSARTSRARA